MIRIHYAESCPICDEEIFMDLNAEESMEPAFYECKKCGATVEFSMLLRAMVEATPLEEIKGAVLK